MLAKWPLQSTCASDEHNDLEAMQAAKDSKQPEVCAESVMPASVAGAAQALLRSGFGTRYAHIACVLLGR